MKKLILAVDNQVSKATIYKLENLYQVVKKAEDLPDEVWVYQALDLGANVFISPDLDIPNLIYRESDTAIWIELPGLKSEKQYAFLIKKLRNIESGIMKGSITI